MSEDWRTGGGYLPEFMQDFHDQKDLFKALDEVMQRSVAKGNHYLKDMSWIDAQIYTVDIFLWVMAGQGYTLQRSRKKGVVFGDIYDFISASKKRWQEQSATALGFTARATPSVGEGGEG